jgi:hypothetical protein
MITEAIWAEKHYIKGESIYSIRNWIRDHYHLTDADLKNEIKESISKMLKETSDGHPCLIRVEDNYRLHPEWRKEWTKKYGKKHKRKPRKKRDPNLPKHPRNAYLFYCQDYRRKRQDEYPDKSMTEITSLLSEEWKNLSGRKKKKYDDLAKEDKKRWEDEMEDYKRNKYSESESAEEERKKKRKRKSDSEESKSHSNKKRRSRHKSESSSESDSESEDFKRGGKKNRSEKKHDDSKDQKSEKSDTTEKKKDK